jgi:hypothetical protein
MEKLENNAKLQQVIEAHNALVDAFNKLNDRRGPKSEREMTDDDARSIMFGENKDLSHKAAAEKMNLSYAQVYSCRKGFTFKQIHREMQKRAAEATQS